MASRRSVSRSVRLAVLSPLFLLLLASSLAGCADYAVRLSARLARSARVLEGQPDGSLTEFAWRPARRSGPYRVLFLPAGEVSAAQLEAAGVPPAEAVRIDEELAVFAEISEGLVVIAQEGEPLAFTSYWTRYASVDEILAGERRSPAEYPTIVRLVNEDGKVVVKGVR